jgi:large subunit ribosomal protein L3
MQVWPRKRAKRQYPRVSRSASSKEAKLIGFAGYKAGMTHVIATDGRKNSMTKGEDISIPVTVLECPPLRIAGVRLYKKSYGRMQPTFDILAKPDKELARKIKVPKKTISTDKLDSKPEDYDDIRLLVQTQPKLTGIGKKKPELFETALGGTKEDKIKFAKENLGKEISVKDVFKEGEQVDIRAVTTGRGTQGPVKRFGVKIRARKAEKTKRGPGSLGGWSGQGHVMYRVAFAGQTGYHNRPDYNKIILLVGDDLEAVNPRGGFIRYGNVKNTYLLMKGSLPGPKKRLVRIESPIRPNKKFKDSTFTIQNVSLRSKQGR